MPVVRPHDKQSFMSERLDWADELKHLCTLLDKIIEQGRSQVQQCDPESPDSGCVVVRDPTARPDPMSQLLAGADRARGAANELFDRMCARPVALLARGYLLSREEYYLLVSRGVLYAGTHTGDPYDDFRMIHYEDDDRRCYINLNEAPRLPGEALRIRFGIPPEEIAWTRLRNDQRDYFERHMPEVAGRFKRDA